MAAVSLSLLPQPLHFSMASKRAPLANNPNAANSPYRVPTAAAAAAGTLATKRSRNQTNEPRENESPPKKKQIIEHIRTGSRRPQPTLIDDQEGRVFTSIPENTNTTAFQRRLAAHSKLALHHQQQQEKRQQQQQQQQPQNVVVDKTEKQTSGDLESIKQWRKHYRRVFPSFVFYFESLPIDVCIRSSRQIAELGAREEKFFSRSVTHIVTSRQIPPPPTEAETLEGQISKGGTSQTRTINPSLLDKSVEPLQQNNNGRSILEAAAERRSQASYQETDSRKSQAMGTDILHKAREMNIKIWALEKFERMMRTMFEDPDGHAESKRKVSHSQVRPNPDADLSQMLRNEKKQQQQARVPWTDIIPFRGLYIYVHDVDEKTKPIAVREYGKVSRREDGEWPQFRSTTLPRCPFIEDKSNEGKTAKSRKKEENHGELHQQPRTRAVSAALEAGKAAIQEQPKTTKSLQESKNAGNRGSENVVASVIPPSRATFEPPKLKASTSCGFDSMLPPVGSRLNIVGARPGREPAASGLQQSNVTSAIKSQVISSTAAAPGIRSGTTKEIHQLQRRAVERRGAMSNNSALTSLSNEARAAPTNENANNNNLRRTTRNKPIEALEKIYEDEGDSEKDEEVQDEKQAAQLTRAPRKKTPIRKEHEAKPGYCENCRDKYDDFSEHTESRKHKKFALSADNWVDLDNLLKKLTRR